MFDLSNGVLYCLQNGSPDYTYTQLNIPTNNGFQNSECAERAILFVEVAECVFISLYGSLSITSILLHPTGMLLSNNRNYEDNTVQFTRTDIHCDGRQSWINGVRLMGRILHHSTEIDSLKVTQKGWE